MAPRNKFTRDEMIAAALRLVREKGMAALTAKSLAQELGVSTQPVFTCFSTMDELKREVRGVAERTYEGYIQKGLQTEWPFFGVGVQYLRFVRENPTLYRLLFLTPEEGGCAIAAMTRTLAIVRDSLVRIYRITPREAEIYFRDMWLTAHGMASLIVTGDCPYSDQELGEILTGMSLGIFKAIQEVPGFAAGEYDRDQEFRNLMERRTGNRQGEEEKKC